MKNHVIEIINGVTEVRFIDVAGLTDLRSAMDDIAKNYYSELRLWDMSSGVNLTESDVKQVASHAKSTFLLPGKSAIVAPSDLTFGISRMGDVYREDGVLMQGVFRTKNEALVWLNE